MRNWKNIFLIFGVLSVFSLSSCHLVKGIEAFNEYNYFEAKKRFEKSLKRNGSPAAYGLSQIYFRTDNPFHNIDSAYHYAIMSVEVYSYVSPKKRQKWSDNIDFQLEDAKKQRDKIGELGFLEAETKNTIEDYRFFMTKYPWSKKIEEAKTRIDSLAFLLAKEEGSSEVLDQFIADFAETKWAKEAKDLLYLAQFEETVPVKETANYMEFIRKYPTNPYIRDAQYQVYVIETGENNIPAYIRFIKRFSSNPFVNDVWKKLYRLSIADYTKESIEKFAKEYPDFPFQNLIKRDLQLVGTNLYLFAQNGRFGFMDENGSSKISPIYEEAEPFKEGLSLVLQEDKYGYINKNGELLIDFQFEEANSFHQGRAIVGKNDKYGLIDVTGNYVLPIEYEEMGPFSEEGLAYIENKEGFQYYTLDGTLAFSSVFDEAFTFENGRARVKRGSKIEYIAADGAFIISVSSGNLRPFTDSLFVHEWADSMNIMNLNGEYIFDKSFDKIGILTNDRAIVEKNGKYGYINEDGGIVIPIRYIPFPNYLELAKFNNNHAVIRKGNNYAMITNFGKEIIPALFTGIGVYGELTPVSKGNGWGYIDKSVNLKIKYQFDYAHEFINGKAIVESNDLYGVIDQRGEIIIPIKYESLTRIEQGKYLVKQNNKIGIIDEKGKEVVKIEYERINEVSNQLYQLIKNKQISYFDISKNHFITLKE